MHVFVRKRLLYASTFTVCAALAATVYAASSRTVEMRDDCDPATFNQNIPPNPDNSPGCVGDGDTTFGEFIAELSEDQTVDKWRFNPDETGLDRRGRVNAHNRGGEVHTFTRVAAFGGGIVPVLNNLSGNPVPAAACGSLAPADFILPGHDSDRVQLNDKGVYKFQCCIHPWMRTTIEVK